MKLVQFGIVCALLSIPAVALADPAAAPAAGSTAATSAANTAKAPERDRVICKAIEETGSLIAKKKVCMTAADWKAKAYASGQWLDRQTATHNGMSDPR
jgi:hypothetical protein